MDIYLSGYKELTEKQKKILEVIEKCRYLLKIGAKTPVKVYIKHMEKRDNDPEVDMALTIIKGLLKNELKCREPCTQ